MLRHVLRFIHQPHVGAVPRLAGRRVVPPYRGVDPCRDSHRNRRLPLCQEYERSRPSTSRRPSPPSVAPAPVEANSLAVAMFQALIPLGLQAVEDALQPEVLALAEPRYAHADGRPAIA